MTSTYRTLPLLTALLTTLLATLAAPAAFAQRDATAQALERFEESLAPQVEDGTLAPQGIGPLLLVGATPAFEETRAWFPAAALEAVTRVFGAGHVRLCEACMNPRVRSDGASFEYNTSLTLPEIARIDRELRGQGVPARSAVWLEETPGGLAVRIVALGNAQVLFSGNFDGQQRERVRSNQVFNATLDLGRRLRGESLTHILVDAAVFPGQHFSLDVVEQFGETNQHLAGLTFSLVDPVAGIGGAYYYIIPPAWNLTLGAQAVLSVPTALVNLVDSGGGASDPFDPMLTGVLVARLPIAATNFGIVAMASTNLTFAIGITMMNVSFLPVLP